MFAPHEVMIAKFMLGHTKNKEVCFLFLAVGNTCPSV